MEKGKQLYLNPDEMKFLSIAVLALMEDLKSTSQNTQHNWNPSARKDLNEMKQAGLALKIKMTKLGFDMRDFPPYEDGEEKNYLTKES